MYHCPPKNPTLALVTNPDYPANGRAYGQEDRDLATSLKDAFSVSLILPQDLATVASTFDIILIRNTGAVISHPPGIIEAWRKNENNWPIFNDLGGKGDVLGKQHLIDLCQAKYPWAIPTVGTVQELAALGEGIQEYVIKPMRGGDSNGMEFLTKDQIEEKQPQGFVIQPRIAFSSEISFYFIGNNFYYALQTNESGPRWELKLYEPTPEELCIARKIQAWNTCTRGIHRIDFGVTGENDKRMLYLMEIEDYNPYLSLEILQQQAPEIFKSFIQHLTEAMLSFAKLKHGAQTSTASAALFATPDTTHLPPENSSRQSSAKKRG